MWSGKPGGGVRGQAEERVLAFHVEDAVPVHVLGVHISVSGQFGPSTDEEDRIAMVEGVSPGMEGGFGVEDAVSVQILARRPDLHVPFKSSPAPLSSFQEKEREV
jgi:hypothetical protein